MNFLSDILLASAAIGAAVFCLVLSRRLRALTTLDSGMGKAIAVLSAQVDDLARTLKAAQHTSRTSAEKLDTQTRRAEAACRQLELLMASLHDLPTASAQPKHKTPSPPGPAHARPPSSWNAAAARRPDPGAASSVKPSGADTELRGPRVLRRRSAARGA